MRRRLGRAQHGLDIAQREFVFAHHFKQIVRRVEAELRGQIVELDGGLAQALQQFLDRLPAFGHGLIDGQRIEPGTHFGPGPVADQIAQFGVEPVARRPALLGHRDLHGLAIFERRIQGHHDTIQARTPAAVPQVGVHAVGKVHRGRTLRQFDDGRIGRQDINPVVKAALPLLAREIALPGQQLAQHRDFGVIGAAGRDARIAFDAGLFIGPVRGHPVFGMVMHGLGADLDLDRLPDPVAHDGVQGLVAVDFWLGNVVVKLLRDRCELAVHPAQRGIAVADGRHHDAQRADVVDLVKTQRFATHLLDDAVDVLGSPLHRGVQALRFQLFLQLRTQMGDIGFTFGPFFVQQSGHLAVDVGLQKTKGQVFHLPLDLPDAQAVGQRREHLQRLLRQTGRHRQLAGGKMAQRLQARGQAQHDDAQIARKRQQHLAHILQLGGGRLRPGYRGRCPCASDLRLACLALHLHQLGGFHRQCRKVVAKGFGDHFLRFVQVVAGIHQVGGGLHRLGPANGPENGRHRVRMGQRVFAGVQRFAGQQRLGKCAGARQCMGLFRQALGRGGNQLR